MKNQILSFAKYSLLCTALLSTAAIAMDPPEESSGLTTKPYASDIPFSVIDPEFKKGTVTYYPPVITYGTLVSTLFLGDAIDGWEMLPNNAASWLQNPQNRQSLQDADGVDLEGFPFFYLETVNENGGIHASYGFRDELNTTSSLFLTLYQGNPFPNGITLAENLDKNDFDEHYTGWKNALKEAQAFTRAVELDSPFFEGTLTPEISHLESGEDLNIRFYNNDKRQAGNFVYLNLNFNDSKRNAQQHRRLNAPIVYNKEVQFCIESLEKINISSLDGTEDQFSNLYCVEEDNDCLIDSKNLYFSTSFFDINGTLKLVAEKMTFTFSTEDRTEEKWDGSFMFRAMGPLTLQSPADINCPIKKINIYPANNQHPTLMCGKVNFGEIPEITLHVANVDRIHVIQKK